MERNIHLDEFENYLKEKTDQYKMYPSDKLWDNINRSVHPRKKWPYISLTALVLLGTVFFVDHQYYSPHNPNRQFSGRETDIKKTEQKVIPQWRTINNNLSEYSNPKNFEGESKYTPDEPSAAKITVTLPEKTSLIAQVAGKGEDIISKSQSPNAFTDSESTVTNINSSENNKSEVAQLLTTNNPENREAETKKVLWGGEPFQKSKFEWQLFFSPTISYRKLTSGVDQISEVFRGIPYSTVEEAHSVSELVTHRPAAGAEIGANLTYKLADNFLLRGGLQLNYSRYQLKAFVAKPEETTLAVIAKPTGPDSINVISTLQNYSGRGASWFNNEYLQISMPIGFEWGVVGNSVLRWNIAASAQPVYNFANNVYLLSTDFTRYGQDPSLIRKWNINAGVETYVSYQMGSFKWQAGPQLRYQLMSSYKSQYPIREYLVDFGFKIGVTKTLK